jgi:tetrapyrrole methylase family protein/MazG family protein/ATP diphosphatase
VAAAESIGEPPDAQRVTCLNRRVPEKSAPLAPDVRLPDPTVKAPEIPLDRQVGEAFPRLVAVMRRLLAPDGCPWDRAQTPDTLKRYVLEEACEVIDAIEARDAGHLREELGDLLLQVVFQAEIARREGTFGPDDVVEGIVEKLVRRHPHVFGDAAAKDAAEVLRNWEQIKAKEKADRGLIEGVPRSLPALVRAQRVGEKVARVGFDWPSIVGVRAKIAEELGELDAALAEGDLGKIEEELGDVLFSLVNLARHVKTPDSGGIDAEGALRMTIDKFVRRFAHVEKRVRDEHGGFGAKPSMEVLDGYWEESKHDDER